MRQRDFPLRPTLRAADIREGVVSLPWKFVGDDPCRSDAETGHGLEESLQPLRVGVEGAEKVPTGFRLVLRLANPQALCQRAPEMVKPCVGHFEHAAYV